MSDSFFIRTSHGLMRISGNVAINYRRGHFIIDNTVDGFTVLELGDKKFVRSLSTGIPSKRLPKQVAVSEEGRIVVGGSDHGVVYVFEESTGSVLDVLSHEEQGLVQTIEVSTPDQNQTKY